MVRPKVDHDGSEKEEEEAVVKRQRVLRSPTTSTTSAAAAAPVNYYSSTQPLCLDSSDKLVGARQPPPTYKLAPESEREAERYSQRDLQSAIGLVTRLVIGHNSASKKSITSKDVASVLSSKLAGIQDSKYKLLGYIRFHVVEQLKQMFGLGLFAGENETKTLASDQWFFTNLLTNDFLTLLANEQQVSAAAGVEDDEDGSGNEEGEAGLADKTRALMLIVLSIIMIHHMSVAESTLHEELVKFGFSLETAAKLKQRNSTQPSIPDVLKILTTRHYVERTKDKNERVYEFGEKANKEVGKRVVLQFISQTLQIKLDPEEENGLLRLQD
ncbi:hypothetical protein BASA81_010035 [Batrachochytrium salamandrivorans]|nr:hypothetical protein BASA81_010035 [Batrachochytrium salamandrivorans]